MKIRIMKGTDARGTFYSAYQEKPWGWIYISGTVVMAGDSDTEEMCVEEVKRKAGAYINQDTIVTEVEI